MKRKSLAILLLFSMVFSVFAVSPVMAEEQTNPVACTMDYNPVCGVDNKTYANRCAAEDAAKVDISYQGECVAVTSEAKLYEKKADVNFAGALIEIGSTDIPTTIIVRDNKSTSTDYTINVTKKTILGQKKDQATNLSDWIPGDQIRVIGKKNENTGVIDAIILVNLSIKITDNEGINGWITDINTASSTISYQWNNKTTTFKYGSSTKFVVGGINPASVTNLKVGDRIRGRLIVRSGQDSVAKIVVVLRRADDLVMKIRTFTPNATLVRLSSTIVPTTMQVRIEKTEGLKGNDVNNLIGSEGALVTINITENTNLVRKYFGKTTLDQFAVGDKLSIVGRVNDNGTVDAKLIKNNSIWKTNTQGHAGVVTDVNVEKSYLMVNWTPIKQVTKKELKSVLEEHEEVTAQAITSEQEEEIKNDLITKLSELKAELKERVRIIEDEVVGKFTRTVKSKKVEIERIKTNDVKVGDLVKRMSEKKMRVDVTPNTKIVVGTNESATISDIKKGDKVRVRGVRHATLDVIVAETIVVVNSLPEVDDSLDTSIDDINEVVSVIDTDNNDGEIVTDTTSETEEEIDTENGDDDSDDDDDDDDDDDSDDDDDDESDDNE